MGVRKLKVEVNELIVGMFVSGLDRPWTQTPFPLQGFYIRDAEEVRLLKTYCRHVYIDVARGSGPVAARLKALATDAVERAPRVSRTSKVKLDVAPLKLRAGLYPVSSALKTEIVFARRLYQSLHDCLPALLSQLASGQYTDTQELRRLAGEMVDSVLRNPDALTWLSRVPQVGGGSCNHTLRACVWALIFGRHMGLSKRDLDTLALGVMLKDTGKAGISPRLLSEPLRSAAEERQYEQFVELSAELLRRGTDLEPRIISVVKSHCERVNGSGFPQQLKGDRIPLSGKIAGIVTFYDEIIHPRDQQYPLSPSRAVARLYECRDKEFQEELVVEFIRAIGLYPTGTLVELNTGEVAVVVEQNFERRLKPKIVIVMDASKTSLPQPLLLDLEKDDREKQALVDSGKKRHSEVAKIEIQQALDPGSHAVDIAQVGDTYLAGSEKKKRFLSFFKKSS